MFNILCLVMMGLVWVRGGRFIKIRTVFFCMRMRGWMYGVFGLVVPHMVMQ